jgi:hypothetical protein
MKKIKIFPSIDGWFNDIIQYQQWLKPYYSDIYKGVGVSYNTTCDHIEVEIPDDIMILFLLTFNVKKCGCEK